MSQDFDYDPDDDDQDDTPPAPERNPLRAEMKKLQKEIRTLRTESEAGKQAVRDLEFVKAGVDVTDPKAKWFLKGYDGDLTAEAIKAAATEAGLTKAEEAPAEQFTPEERASHERMAATNAGAAATGGRDFDAEMRAAKSPKEVQAIFREKGGTVVDD
jgi:hypothetical protein